MSVSDHNLNDDELVAYLDGELDEQRASEIEQRLRDEPELREKLAELQNTWDLLDTLPQGEARHSFTQTTLEFVFDDAKKEIRRSRKGFSPAAIISIVSVLMLLIGGAIGFFAIDYYRKQPIREIIADLDTIENVDQYLILKDVEFLKLLNEESDLFVSDAEIESLDGETSEDSETLSPQKVSFTLREGIDYINSLDDSQLNELKRKQRLFSEQLSDEQKDHVRSIHQAIHSDPEHEQLMVTLQLYHEWIKSLKSSVRADLLELSPEKRIETIRFLQYQQHQMTFGIEDNFQIPNVDDTSKVYRWMRETIDIGRRDEKGKKAARGKGYRSLSQLLENILAEEVIARELFFTDDRIDLLFDGLSPESQYIIAQCPTYDAKVKLIFQWCRAVAAFRVTANQREAVYRSLTADEKSDLDEMSIESRRRHLDILYWKLKRSR